MENDLISKDQMTNLGCLLVCTLVAAHAVNNLDLGHEQSFKNEDYEIN